MNLVNKQNGSPLEKPLLVLSLSDDVPHVGCLGAGRGQRHKPDVVLLAVVGYDVGQRGLRRQRAGCETEGRALAPARGLDTGALGSREPAETARRVFTH